MLLLFIYREKIMSKTKISNQIKNYSDGVGKKFLIISISLTVILNGSVALWFIWYVKKYGIDKFIS